MQSVVIAHHCVVLCTTLSPDALQIVFMVLAGRETDIQYLQGDKKKKPK